MTTINIHTETPLKNKAQAVFEGMGFDMSTAVNLFFRHIAYGEALPFEAGRAKPESEKPSKFIFGGWEGKIIMPDDFNEPMEEFEEYAEKPILSPDFTMEDLYKLREYNSLRRIKMTTDELIADIRKGSDAMQDSLEARRKEKLELAAR